MEIYFFVLFGLLYVACMAWLFCCYRLFKMLEDRHSDKYKSMGCPHLIKNNSFSTNKALMKFLFKREWLALEDKGIEQLSRLMLILFIFLIVGFIALFFLLPFGVEALMG